MILITITYDLNIIINIEYYKFPNYSHTNFITLHNKPLHTLIQKQKHCHFPAYSYKHSMLFFYVVPINCRIFFIIHDYKCIAHIFTQWTVLQYHFHTNLFYQHETQLKNYYL